jgi:putative oxidoreductase
MPCAARPSSRGACVPCAVSAPERTEAVRTIWDERGRWALLPVRLMVGFGFAAHGLAKLGRGPAHFALILQTLGIPAPNLAAWVTSLLELVGGLGLMVGLAVVPLAAPLAVVMLTAMFGVHLRYGFSSIRLEALTSTGARFGPVGYELNLLYLAGLLALALGGAGPASLDGLLARRRRDPP